MQELEEDEEELYEHHRIVVEKGQELVRLDKYLMMRMQNATRNKIQNGIDLGLVKVNDIVTKASYKVKPFDVVTVSLPHLHAKVVSSLRIFLWILFMKTMICWW
jgi:23S rRNA pseudouridine1911/1915/1917 synthase